MVTSGSGWFARCMNSISGCTFAFALFTKVTEFPAVSVRLMLVNVRLKLTSLSFAVAPISTTTVEFPAGGGGFIVIMLPELQPAASAKHGIRQEATRTSEGFRREWQRARTARMFMGPPGVVQSKKSRRFEVPRRCAITVAALAMK